MDLRLLQHHSKTLPTIFFQRRDFGVRLAHLLWSWPSFGRGGSWQHLSSRSQGRATTARVLTGWSPWSLASREHLGRELRLFNQSGRWWLHFTSGHRASGQPATQRPAHCAGVPERLPGCSAPRQRPVGSDRSLPRAEVEELRERNANCPNRNRPAAVALPGRHQPPERPCDALVI